MKLVDRVGGYIRSGFAGEDVFACDQPVSEVGCPGLFSAEAGACELVDFANIVWGGCRTADVSNGVVVGADAGVDFSDAVFESSDYFFPGQGEHKRVQSHDWFGVKGSYGPQGFSQEFEKLGFAFRGDGVDGAFWSVAFGLRSGFLKVSVFFEGSECVVNGP